VSDDGLLLGFCTVYPSYVSSFHKVSIFMVTEMILVCVAVIWKKTCKVMQGSLRVTGQLMTGKMGGADMIAPANESLIMSKHSP
jgi:hypothetical protein